MGLRVALRVIVFGASGMVGQGVLRECLLDPEVTAVVSVVRRASGPLLGRRSEKLLEVIAPDLCRLEKVEGNLLGFDACFFCAGVSAAGMKEAEYRRVTFDVTLAVARTLLRLNPTNARGGMTFVYVSGAGTDAQGRAMWARVKGETEDALGELGFREAYMFRPGVIVPLDGIRSKTKLYDRVYRLLGPVLPLLLRWFPRQIATTEQVGRAMLAVARRGYPGPVLEQADITGLG